MVVLSLAASGFALVFTRSPLFGWLRNFAADCSGLLGDLASCYFCMGTWFALGLTWFYPPGLLALNWWADWLASAMAVTALAGLISGSISLLVNLQNWAKSVQ
jgi:Protein of unknown function (DUF1360)